MTENVSRRQVAKGAAWAVPTIAAAAVAPAVAASRVTLTRSYQITNTSSGCASGQAKLVLATDNSTYYFKINNATTSMISSVTASLLVQKSVVDAMTQTFALTSSNTASWSNPVREGGSTPVTYTDASGVVYYRYYSTFVGTIPAPVNNVITLPTLTFTSTCHSVLYTNSNSTWVNGRGAVTLTDGTQVVNVGAYRQI